MAPAFDSGAAAALLAAHSTVSDTHLAAAADHLPALHLHAGAEQAVHAGAGAQQQPEVVGALAIGADACDGVTGGIKERMESMKKALRA